MELYKNIVNKISTPAEKKTKQKEYHQKGLYPIIDQGQSLIGGYTDDGNKLLKCDLPVVVFGDHTKCVKYVDFPFCPGADGIKVLRAKENVLPKYLKYLTLFLTFKIEDKGYARHYQYIEKKEVEIPSIQQQKLVVMKIEELFSRIDDGIANMVKINTQLDVYRHAVLKDAFKNVSDKKRIKEVSSIVTSGSRGWAKYYSDNGKARFIRITDLTRDRICLKNGDIQYLDLPENVEGKRSRLNENDVLVSITADLGSIALVPHDIGEAYINQHIAMIRFNNATQGKLMSYYLKSDYGQKDLLKNKRGGGKLGLGLDDIRNAFVPDITDEKAKEIVDEIESRFSVCEDIVKMVNETMAKAKGLRQSILKQAFEGGLV